MVNPIDWTNALALEDYVVRLFKKEGADSLGFRVLVRIYGKAKIEGFLKKPENADSLSTQLSWSHILATQSHHGDWVSRKQDTERKAPS